MAFRETGSGSEFEKKAGNVALELDQIALNNDIQILAKAIKLMGSNTRDTLKGALEMAEK